jgi:hypothetical protein
MKKLTLRMMAFAALQGSALLAQNIIGNWQGTLQAGPQKVRIVFKIALENDKLKATLYTVDRPSAPIATTITWDSSTVKMTTPALHGNYEGKLGGDGNSIAGTWTQGAPLALNLARATPETPPGRFRNLYLRQYGWRRMRMPHSKWPRSNRAILPGRAK